MSDIKKMAHTIQEVEANPGLRRNLYPIERPPQHPVSIRHAL